MTEEPETETRLVIFEYETENERKRLEYNVKNTEGVESERPNGTIRLLEGDQESLDDLESVLTKRVNPENLRMFDTEERDVSGHKKTRSYEQVLPGSQEAVDATVEYILSDFAHPAGSTDEGEMIYEGDIGLRVVYESEEVDSDSLSEETPDFVIESEQATSITLEAEAYNLEPLHGIEEGIDSYMRREEMKRNQ